MSGGGRFDFDDGGTYCGGWEDGKAHGHGVCTGPKGQGEYSGAWQHGYEICGVYTWPNGNNYQGQWTQGKRHGLGIETKGRWVYRGEWTQGFKGRYGVRQSTSSGAKYEGTWTTGLQDGYGVETYADGDLRLQAGDDIVKGTYQGQWLRGMRHGYGVRQSVPYGLASHYRPKALRDSLTSLRSENEDDHVVKDRDRKIDESRGGFVLKADSEDSPGQRRRSIFDKHGRTSLRKTLMSGLKLRKQKSTGDINDSPRRTSGSMRSTVSNISHTSADSSHSGVTNTSVYTESNHSFVSQDDITDANVTETYMGEWKNDKRSGFGISERSDGLKYEGEWYNNKKYGYGVTTFKDRTKEEGKYKNNTLISSGKKGKLIVFRSSKMRERVENAVAAAQRAAQIALQKADIAISRMSNARDKADQADNAAATARNNSDMARIKAKEVAPEFHQPGTDIMKKRLAETGGGPTDYASAKPFQNHAHQGRSKSVMIHRGGSPSPSRNLNPAQALLEPTLDTALAGSSSKLLQDLHQYDDSERSSRGGSPYGGLDDPRSRDHYSRSSQRGRMDFPHGRFSDLLNSTVVSDHFDQYSSSSQNDLHQEPAIRPVHAAPAAATLPSPRRSPQPERMMRHRDEPAAAPPMIHTTIQPVVEHHLVEHTVLRPAEVMQVQEAAPNNHADERMDTVGELRQKEPTDNPTEVLGRPLQRRKTLPSIVKRPVDVSEKKPAEKAATIARNKGVTPTPVRSQPETIIIENGIRKRVKEETEKLQKMKGKETADLPNRFKLESQQQSSRGSLPDVSIWPELEKNIMPREEVAKLSSKRRAELIRLRQEEERRKQQEIVLRLTDLKDWCQERQLLMFVIAVNVSLATMFVNLLSQ